MSRPTRRISAVLFDLGGTLVDTRDFEGWAGVGRSQGLDVDSESISVAWERASSGGAASKSETPALWTEILSRASATEVAPELAQGFLEAKEQRPLYGSLFSDVRRCLDRLTSDGRLLGIVSNSRSEGAVRDLLRSLEIESAFEIVVSSGTEGVRKPSSEIFRRALDRIVAPANGTLFVGDDIENDVRGPIAAGLHAVWLNRLGTGGDLGGAEILSLSEVPRTVRLLEAGAPVK